MYCTVYACVYVCMCVMYMCLYYRVRQYDITATI